MLVLILFFYNTFWGIKTGLWKLPYRSSGLFNICNSWVEIYSSLMLEVGKLVLQIWPPKCQPWYLGPNPLLYPSYITKRPHNRPHQLQLQQQQLQWSSTWIHSAGHWEELNDLLQAPGDDITQFHTIIPIIPIIPIIYSKSILPFLKLSKCHATH
jgi:hypothetical protein